MSILLAACEKSAPNSVDGQDIAKEVAIKRLEIEKNHLAEAKTLLSNKKITNDEWKTIVKNLEFVSKDNSSYQEAQNLLPRAQTKIAQIEKEEKKLQRADIEKGRKIHKRLISKYPQLDRSYFDPFISGSGTTDPRCDIVVTVRDWKALTESDKFALGVYTASLVDKVKADPFKYSGVAADAPAAKFIATNIAKMTRNSWCILLGDVSGSDISLDEIGMCGYY